MKIFDPKNIEIGEKSYKNILIYCIVYTTIKDLKYVKINSVNSFYLIFSKVNECFEEINKNTYLAIVTTNESSSLAPCSS